MTFFDKQFLLCPGVEKSGTTSLYAFLQDRPGIAVPHLKETFFFNSKEEIDPARYEAMFREPATSDQDSLWYADITPSYFRQDKTLERIKTTLNDKTVILFLIRNPLKRAFSLYWHDMVRHVTKGEKAVDGFKDFRNLSFEHMMAMQDTYLFRPYAPMLKAWRAAFPGRVIVHTLEDVIANPDNLINDINKMTGLQLETGRSFPRENAAWTARLSIFPEGLRRHADGKVTRMTLPRAHAINAMAIQGTFTHHLTKAQCERIFNQAFADDVRECEEILGRNLDEFREQTDLVSPIVKEISRFTGK